MASNNQVPYVEIIEQPSPKALRFRYECEGRMAGSLPGASSTAENKTYPAIKVHNYKGEAVVVVSCVTKDKPYKPHPHSLVGKEGCSKGVCTIRFNNDSMICTFPNLGIQCIKKKGIDEALRVRESLRVDPFNTGFSHRSKDIDLNVVRLCFQVFVEGNTPGKFNRPLEAIVSEPILDKKAMCDLLISDLSHYASPCSGNQRVFLLCEKIVKDDIQIKLFDDQGWEAFAEFQHVDVWKQVAIKFKTPPYKYLDRSATVFIQLVRPSDGATSEPRQFCYYPVTGTPFDLNALQLSYADDGIRSETDSSPDISDTSEAESVVNVNQFSNPIYEAVEIRYVDSSVQCTLLKDDLALSPEKRIRNGFPNPDGDYNIPNTVTEDMSYADRMMAEIPYADHNDIPFADDSIDNGLDRTYIDRKPQGEVGTGGLSGGFTAGRFGVRPSYQDGTLEDNGSKIAYQDRMSDGHGANPYLDRVSFVSSMVDNRESIMSEDLNDVLSMAGSLHSEMGDSVLGSTLTLNNRLSLSGRSDATFNDRPVSLLSTADEAPRMASFGSELSLNQRLSLAGRSDATFTGMDSQRCSIASDRSDFPLRPSDSMASLNNQLSDVSSQRESFMSDSFSEPRISIVSDVSLNARLTLIDNVEAGEDVLEKHLENLERLKLEDFDDSKTYSSYQMAMKDPMLSSFEENDIYDNPFDGAPPLPPKPSKEQPVAPPRTSSVIEEKTPPLPPRKFKKMNQPLPQPPPDAFKSALLKAQDALKRALQRNGMGSKTTSMRR